MIDRRNDIDRLRAVADVLVLKFQGFSQRLTHGSVGVATATVAIRVLCLLIALMNTAVAQQTEGSTSEIDPYKLTDTPRSQMHYSSAGLTLRPVSINSHIRNLVLICAGQSNRANTTPTLYIPKNKIKIDAFNVNDGAFWSIDGPLPGASYPAGGIGPGNVCARVADNLIKGGQWDHIYLVPLAEDGSNIAEWATGPFANRIAVAMARLKALGITPQTRGFTFAVEWGQGETDNQLGTSRRAYLAGLRTVISNAAAAGFSGRWFIAIETWLSGVTSPDIQAAQAAIVNKTSIFQSCNCDTIGADGRNDRAGHFNDKGAAIAAALIAKAIHASSPPFKVGGKSKVAVHLSRRPDGSGPAPIATFLQDRPILKHGCVTRTWIAPAAPGAAWSPHAACSRRR